MPECTEVTARACITRHLTVPHSRRECAAAEKLGCVAWLCQLPLLQLPPACMLLFQCCSKQIGSLQLTVALCNAAGIIDCGKQIVEHEGTKSLWKGLTPFATHLTLKYALRMGTNAFYQSLLRDEVGARSVKPPESQLTCSR